ncbi:hypothetical protein DFH07DRAFT_782362 [Mycena maculata]|uniref:Uncharacterized protein n=1 Tax=Mycena maculata TaxID=230809 RepID=A0AAD7HTA6_9AGAR|nr:hypothetical protein DFH07DRAFT_782362 [Mycena maculata]
MALDPKHKRQLINSLQVSYFLPSRESGVNDMYLHLGFRSPPGVMKRSRVCSVWAILRLKHPLLASKVEMYDYDDIRFVWVFCVATSKCLFIGRWRRHVAPESVLEAISSADASLEYRSQSKDEMIETYLNGPRTLSNERLSYLVVSQQLAKDCPQSIEEASASDLQDFDMLLCATHFLGNFIRRQNGFWFAHETYVGDGMALHQFANDFFTLLASGRAGEDLESMLTEEWFSRWGGNKEDNVSGLPSSLETRLPPMSDGKFRRTVSRVDFETSQAKLIGGHSFPRRSGNPRKTVVPTVFIDPEHTKMILKKCKAQSTSISSAMFAICNIAWARTCDRNWELPINMYSALNLRSVLTASKALNDSYWYLAISYFNVVLPAFIPKTASDNDIEKIFWHRARDAKNQSTRAAKSAMLVSRSYEMARERGQRARCWAREDDEKARGTWKAPAPSAASTNVAKKPPSAALIGLSLLGNLDGIYKHSTFPDVQLHTLTTGSRQRAGGMLLFGYTFVGKSARKLWISLGYDQGGFDIDTVERFWRNVLTAVDTLLV